MHISRWLSVFLVCLSSLLLSACTTGETAFFESAKKATPLPAEFVLFAKSDDEKKAWRLTLESDVYVWQSKEEPMRTVLIKLDAPAPEGFYVAILSEEGNETHYGLIRISDGAIASYAFNAGPVAETLGIKTQSDMFSTKFKTEADLVAVFGDMAKRIPADATGKVKIGDVEVTVAQFVTFDFADPAKRKEGEAALAQFGKEPE